MGNLTWVVRAATPSAGHGLSADLLLVDEVWGDVKPGWSPARGVPGLPGLDPIDTPVTMGHATRGSIRPGTARVGTRALGVA